MIKIVKGKLDEVMNIISNDYGVEFEEYEKTFETKFYQSLNFRMIVIFKVDMEIRTVKINGDMFEFVDEDLLKQNLLLEERGK